jgi:hypothetical protein
MAPPRNIVGSQGDRVGMASVAEKKTAPKGRRELDREEVKENRRDVR